jgi:hypothetical protein
MTSSFGLNEWTFIGLSVYKTDRVTDSQEIHLVTKTKSGTENQDSFNDQDFKFECIISLVNPFLIYDNLPIKIILRREINSKNHKNHDCITPNGFLF